MGQSPYKPDILRQLSTTPVYSTMTTNFSSAFTLESDRRPIHEATDHGFLGPAFGKWPIWQILLMMVIFAATYDQGLSTNTIR